MWEVFVFVIILTLVIAEVAILFCIRPIREGERIDYVSLQELLTHSPHSASIVEHAKHRLDKDTDVDSTQE